MSYYLFIARTDDSRSESLGIMDLCDDGDARSFASRIIGDMMHTHPGVYGTWTLDIVEDERAVASIPFAYAIE